MSILFSRFSFYIALAGLLYAGSLVFRLAAQDPIPQPPHAPPLNPYAHAVAAAGLVEAQGENIALGVPVAGLVTAVYAKVWDNVASGQPLLQFDDRELQAALIGQHATVRVAEATTDRLRGQLTRLEKVADERAITREELETRRSDVQVAEAQLAAARAAVEQTEALIARLTVRAPRAATVLQVNTRPGEFVIPGVTRSPLVLGDLTYLQVRADIDEQIAPRVKPGMTAIGYLKGDTQRPIKLEFVRIEPFVIPKTSLTGGSAERVDTRVLQVIYRFLRSDKDPVYVGQQLDLYLEE
ncbi:MAG: efflux RND transporter periplasmic adaptor subunit [bacterium]